MTFLISFVTIKQSHPALYVCVYKDVPLRLVGRGIIQRPTVWEPQNIQNILKQLCSFQDVNYLFSHALPRVVCVEKNCVDNICRGTFLNPMNDFDRVLNRRLSFSLDKHVLSNLVILTTDVFFSCYLPFMVMI